MIFFSIILEIPDIRQGVRQGSVGAYLSRYVLFKAEVRIYVVLFYFIFLTKMYVVNLNRKKLVINLIEGLQ